MDPSFVISRLTTGDCAAAAARAAAVCLLFKTDYEYVSIQHGDNSPRTIPVYQVSSACNDESAHYYAIMEGGNAPDIREKAEIHVTVSKIKNLYDVSDNAHIDMRYGNLFLCGGEGIGTAKMDTADIKKGEPLIEKDARKLIFDAVAEACEISDGAQLLQITVSCPDGMMIAAKQTMGQNMFTGGITILGDYGRIFRIHQRDITSSIADQVKKQANLGVKNFLVAPGNYCAKEINDSLHVSLKNAVRCFNYPGDAIDAIVANGGENMLLVGNVGKLVKLAAGIMNTNSYASDARREIFSAHTAIVGGTSSQVRTVMGCNTTDEILALLDSWGIRDKVMSSIMLEISNAVYRRSHGKLKFGVALFSKEFGLLGQTDDTRNVLVKVSQEQYALSLKLK